jgi:A-kinase anchor protein 13
MQFLSRLNSSQEASRIASCLCTNGATNLSRSASSVGEHQSNAYISPSLPRRAETFGGFDNSAKDPAGTSSFFIVSLNAAQDRHN